MDPITDGLGRYTTATPAGHLRLHDVGEVLRRTGLQLGFVPLSEYKAVYLGGSSHPSKLDWVWRRPQDGSIAAAFEIEGRNVALGSLLQDHLKLRQVCDAALWVVLFQVDHDFAPKGTAHGPNYREEVARLLDGYGQHRIRVALDVDLWDAEFRKQLAS